jgi:hypothetical protein
MRKAFGCDVAFILMNSFSTSADTRAALAAAHPELLEEPLIELLQNKSPKVDAATLAPATHPAAPDNEWCAPCPPPPRIPAPWPAAHLPT